MPAKPTDLPPGYGARIRNVRRALHLTQEQLAADLGTSVISLSRWEREIFQPPAAVWEQIQLREAGLGWVADARDEAVRPLVLVFQPGMTTDEIEHAITAFLKRYREPLPDPAALPSEAP